MTIFYDYFHKYSSTSNHIVSVKNFTYKDLLMKINKILDIRKKFNNILDYGCGVGVISIFLANKGYKVVGVDISKKAIDICRKNLNTVGLDSLKNKVDFNVINNKLKIGRSSQDLIICSEVIEHVKNDKYLVKKFNNYLKKGGYLFITTPSKNSPLHKIGLTKYFDKKVGHLRRYNENDLTKLLLESGFEVVSIQKKEGILKNSLFIINKINFLIRYIKGPLVDVFYFVDNILLKFFGEADLYVLAIKK